MCLSKVGCTDDTDVDNTVQTNSTKIKGFIAPHALIKTRKVIIVVDFQD